MRTVSFFRFPEEEARFIDFLEGSADVRAVLHETVDDLSKLRPQPLRAVLARPGATQFVFTLEEHAPALFSVSFEGGHGIDTMHSPVIMYRRGFLYGPQKLGATSLTAYASTLEDHVKWCSKVFRWVRKDAPVQVTKGWRATRAIADALEKGALELGP